jgi:hypothetical protein
MPDTRTPELLLIRRQEAAARPRQAPPDHSWPASQYIDPTARQPKVRLPKRPNVPGLDLTIAKPKPDAIVLTARRSLKVTTVLDPHELLDISLPDGKPSCVLTIQLMHYGD